jgi:hypothetical protein
MPAPPRALSRPVIPCAAPIPMGPRKDLPVDPISSGGPRLHGGPSERDRPGRHALPPIHRAKAAVQHAQSLPHIPGASGGARCGRPRQRRAVTSHSADRAEQVDDNAVRVGVLGRDGEQIEHTRVPLAPIVR